jgi:hypothetical protein
MSKLAPLGYYEKACRAVAEALSVDELKKIRAETEALKAAAKVAKNRGMEADAIAIRMRAVRRLDELIKAQKNTVGLAKGGKPYQRSKLTGAADAPVATLAMQDIDKHLAKQARTLGALSDERFEAVVAEARDKVNRAVRNTVREVELEQERAAYASRIEQGCTVDDLAALAASGFRASAICADFPWEFKVYSGKGKQRSAERHYDTWPLERIATFAREWLPRLAAKRTAVVGGEASAAGRVGGHRRIRVRVQIRRLRVGKDEAVGRVHHARWRRPALGHGLRHADQHRTRAARHQGRTAAPFDGRA